MKKKSKVYRGEAKAKLMKKWGPYKGPAADEAKAGVESKPLAEEGRDETESERRLLMTRAEFDKRLAVCMACEFLRHKDSVFKRCARCGCFMIVKGVLRRARCPEQKW